VLGAEKLTKNFGGLIGVRDFDLGIAEGRCVGVIGPNGAGKTTLINLLSGTLQPTSGRVLLDGHDINSYTPDRRALLGIIRSFQLNSLFWGFTTLDNMRVAYYGQRQRGLAWRSVFGRYSFGDQEKEFLRRASNILKTLGIDHLKDKVVSKFTCGQQRLVTFAVSLMAEPKFLLLDEPIAGLSWQEGTNLMQLVHRETKDRGIGTLIVEHNVRTMVSFVDQLIAMSFGCKVTEGAPLEVVRDERVVASYLGGS
jgi:ABC-type branched-subunit amino acid transport system ATPase component